MDIHVLSMRKIEQLASIMDIEVILSIDNVQHTVNYSVHRDSNTWPLSEELAKFESKYPMIQKPLWELVYSYYHGEPIQFPFRIEDKWVRKYGRDPNESEL